MHAHRHISTYLTAICVCILPVMLEQLIVTDNISNSETSKWCSEMGAPAIVSQVEDATVTFLIYIEKVAGASLWGLLWG